MKFLIDADCPRSIGTMLRETGHSVVDIRDLNPCAPDTQIYQIIQQEALILITRDTDFSNILRYPVGPNCGIILLRVHMLSVEEILTCVRHLLTKVQEKNLLGCLTVVRRNRFRFHRF